MPFLFEIFLGWLPVQFQVMALSILGIVAVLLVLKLIAKVIEALPFI